MREIASNEVCRLENCLLALAAHHNKVSVHFKGCYPKTPVAQTIKRFAEELDNGNSCIAVVEDDHMIIGFCKINIDGHLGILEYLIVLENYRGMGYGAALMEWALHKFSDCGVRDIDVKVADGNAAVSLYEKYGFKMNAHILRLSR
ncbi:MAG: GNAT family N-acetyltransferase [Oscillospiraceae bacterium]|nr:GNAT family N-acetyltransferase [Oscillospiraceae bacterium]